MFNANDFLSPEDTPIFSQNDLLNTYRSYDASEETKTAIINFISELTGKSSDAILEMI